MRREVVWLGVAFLGLAALPPLSAQQLKLRLTLGGGQHTHSFEFMAFSPDGKTLASGSDDKTVMLWDVAKGGR
jgi:WD40 repeat protein